jgi:hypothetical protein
MHKTTIPRQSFATARQQSSFPSKLPQLRLLRMSMSSKHNLSLSATTTQQRDSPPSQCGNEKQAICILARPHNKSSRQRLQKDMAIRHKAASTPQWLQPMMTCAMTMTTTTQHPNLTHDHANHKTVQGIHKNIWSQRWDLTQNINQPDQTIPKKVKPRQSVHHGTDWTGQQCYLGGGHEEPHGRQDNTCLLNPSTLPTQHRNSTKDAIAWQWVLRWIQGIDQAQPNEVPACPSKQPQTEHCWDSHKNFQSPLHQYLMRVWQILPTTLMG